MVAVLHRLGGLFMDIGTLVVDDLAPLNTAYLELLDRSVLLRMVRRTALARRFWPSAAGESPATFSNAIPAATEAPLWKRIGRRWVRASVADQHIRLDRSKDGFIAEAWNAKDLVSPAESYCRFWFEGDNDTAPLFRPGVRSSGCITAGLPTGTASRGRRRWVTTAVSREL